MRHSLSKDWVSILSEIVLGINKRHLKSLGGLTPNSIQSPLDDVKVQQNIGLDKLNVQPTVRQQIQNQIKYEKNVKKNPIQANCYVLPNFKREAFFRSFDMQVYMLQADIPVEKLIAAEAAP